MIAFKKTTIEVGFARLFVILATGIVVGVAAHGINETLGQNLPFWLPYALGATASLLSIPATRRAFNFAADCMQIPERMTQRVTQGAQRLSSREEPALPETKASNVASDARPAPAVRLCQSACPDGSISVTVETRCLGKRKFTTLRGRLESITGIKWSFPKNHGDERRTISGLVRPGPHQQAAVTKLEQLAKQSS